MAVASAEAYLPHLFSFVRDLVFQYEQGELTSPDVFREKVLEHFPEDRLDRVDSVVMGWKKMASWSDQVTLVHVVSALVSVLLLPEFKALSPDQQNLALWIVLYHDVDKEVHNHRRDPTHGFRSAGVTGLGLHRLGFLPDIDDHALHEWVELTRKARVYSDKFGEDIQDNRRLPELSAGIESLFGIDTPTGLIVRVVLFHMSLSVVKTFPAQAELTDEEIRAYFTPEFVPLLEVMMHTDNDAWAMFEAERKAVERQQTQAEFQRVRALLGMD